MNRLVVVIAIGVLASALGALSLGCGNSSDKPPLTPDSEHGMMDEAGAGAMSPDGGK